MLINFKYLFIVISVFAGILNLKSQIIYHDLNPDIIFPNANPLIYHSYELDVDNDGVKDYRFLGENNAYGSGYIYNITPYNGNKVLMQSNASLSPIDTLIFGDSISINSIYKSGNTKIVITSASTVYPPPYTWSAPWGNIENHFIGICFTSSTGVKCGWIRLRNRLTIADCAYNSVSNQPILAGEGLARNLAENIVLSDIGNNGNGDDMRVKFCKALDETSLSGYKVVFVPKTNLTNFTIDSAKKVSNANSFLIPIMNKDIDTVLNASLKDIYGNLITSLKPYYAYVLSLPNLTTSFDTLISSISNEVILEVPNFPANSLQIISTKIPSNFYNLNAIFNIPATENGILNYRLIFIPANDSVSFTIDSANNVLPNNYLTISKTGLSQNLSFQSNLVKTYKGDALLPFKKYKAVLLSVSDTIISYYSKLSNVSNSFTVYTQVPAVNKLYVTDLLDNHNCSDLKIEFEKIQTETNMTGYRGLIVPKSSAPTYNLDSANIASNYITIPKTGLNQSVMMPTNTLDVYGNAILESEMYCLYILTLSDGINTDVNNLSAFKYFKYSTPKPFYAGSGVNDTLCKCYDISNVTLNFSGNYFLDLDSNGVYDLKFSHDYMSSAGGYYGNAWVSPLNQTQIYFFDLLNGFAMAHDSGDVIDITMNWGSSDGTIRLDSQGPPMPPNPATAYHTGMWNNTYSRYLAVKLINQGMEYLGWVKLSAIDPYRMTIYSYCVQKYGFVGINEYEKEHKINIWPNPTLQNVYFDKVIEKVEIVDVLGNVIDIKENVNLIDMSHFSNGVYYLRLHFDENIFTRKIMVVR